MKYTQLLLIAILGLCSANEIHGLEGAWYGALELPSGSLPLVFHFDRSADGMKRYTIDSPAQQSKGLMLMCAYQTPDSVSVYSMMLGMSYNARVTPDSLVGTFRQNGMAFPLTLKPDAPVVERPQTPRPPYPYTTQDVTFVSSDGTTLAGTYTLPVGYTEGEQVPAVVMVTGSGQQDRDETIADHRPFAVIADYLARNGIASLRYDDRSVGRSGGSIADVTLRNNTLDASAALSWLRSQPSVSYAGILGHSEGGMIGVIMAADESLHPDFVVSLAGPSMSIVDLMIYQNRATLLLAKVEEDIVGTYLGVLRGIFDGSIAAHAAVDNALAAYRTSLPDSMRQNLKACVDGRRGWLKEFLEYDIVGDIRHLQAPVLLLGGELDVQVPAVENAASLMANAPQGYATTKTYPSLNHLFQHATTGSTQEYSQITETLSPEVLQDIVDYIKTRR